MASVAVTPLRWSIAEPGDLAWRAWDGEVVARAGATGDTHHLGPLSSAVFQVLTSCQEGVSALDVATSLAATTGDSAEDLLNHIVGALEELQRIGLARPASG